MSQTGQIGIGYHGKQFLVVTRPNLLHRLQLVDTRTHKQGLKAAVMSKQHICLQSAKDTNNIKQSVAYLNNAISLTYRLS